MQKPCGVPLTGLFLPFLARHRLCELVGFAHQHGQRRIVGPEQVDHLVERHVRYQVTAHHQDVGLETEARETQDRS